MGSSCAAFLAGYHPKKTPVKVQTAKLIMIVHGSMDIGQWANALIVYEAPITKDNSDYSTCYAKHNSFNKKLVENIYSSGSNAHPQTYFPCTFSDAHIHDVHNADTTNNKRDSSHASKMIRYFIDNFQIK